MIIYIEGNGVIVKTNIYVESEIDKLVSDLQEGHIVAIATDTVMGLAARADLESVFIKLKEIKGRSEKRPLPVMVANLKQLGEIVELNKRDQILVNKWFPGAITFIFNKKNDTSLVGVYKTLAVRIPNDEVLLEIVTKLDKPIFLTSANKSDQPTTKNYQEVFKIFENKIKSILKRNALGYDASTIVDTTKDRLQVLRKGNISLDDILESLEE